MIDLKTMTIQFIDGEPEGIRICRVEGESLVTVVVPREKLAQAKALPELPHRGVYYLSTKTTVPSRAYTRAKPPKALYGSTATKPKRSFGTSP